MGVLSKAASPVNMSSSPEPAEKMNGVERRPERLRDWLINQINSGKFRGLQWLDEEKTVFQVPWIHAKKRDYDEERDSALFKEWAMHTGKYKPHENKTIGYDPTTWKINFRCALNGLKDIMELKEHQTEWYRVYKVLPSAAKKKRVKGYNTHRARPYPTITMGMSNLGMAGEYPPQEFCEGWSSAPVYNPYQQAPLLPPVSQYLPTICNTSTASQFAPTDCHGATGGSLSPFSGPATYVSGTIVCPGSLSHSGDEYVEKDCSSHGSPLHSDHGSRSPSHSPHSMSPTTHLVDTPLLPPITTASQQYHSVAPLSTVGSVPDIPVTSASCPVQQQPISQCCYIDQIIKEIETNPALSPTMSPSLHQDQVQVTILYGSIAVHTEVLSCSQGCRIGLNISLERLLKGGEKIFGPPEAHQIPLPPNHPDGRAVNILDAMKRGLILNVSNNDIYATALCRATVHHGSSPREASFPLAREETCKVFDYNNDFLPLLENWSPGKPYPTPYTIFSLGQGWGRGGRHVAQNLINVIVTSLQAQRDLQARGVFRRLPSEELNNVPDPFDVYEETHLDTLADIQLEQPQGTQRFELPGSFNLPQY